MARFRKKPVVIEAFKWTGGPDQTEDPEWIIEAIRSGVVWFESGYMVIDTLEGAHIANQGDWIIRGINGELYPCKPDIFERTYEPVENSETSPGAIRGQRGDGKWTVNLQKH